MALTRQQDGRVDEAIQIAREQLKSNPEDAAGAFILAQALLKKAPRPSDSLFTEAQNTLEKSVRLAPQFAPARALLGKVYLQGNRIEQAVQQLEIALKLEPENRAASYQLMVASKRLGRMPMSRRCRKRYESPPSRNGGKTREEAGSAS